MSKKFAAVIAVLLVFAILFAAAPACFAAGDTQIEIPAEYQGALSQIINQFVNAFIAKLGELVQFIVTWVTQQITQFQ